MEKYETFKRVLEEITSEKWTTSPCPCDFYLEDGTANTLIFEADSVKIEEGLLVLKFHAEDDFYVMKIELNHSRSINGIGNTLVNSISCSCISIYQFSDIDTHKKDCTRL